jgi:hypothetical protein
MRVLHFAIAMSNLACQSAFLFLATYGPMLIASSSASTLLQCGIQYCLWTRSFSPHAATRCEDDHMIGMKSMPRCWHRMLCLSVFVFSESADLVPAFRFQEKRLLHAPVTVPEGLTAFDPADSLCSRRRRLFSE